MGLLDQLTGMLGQYANANPAAPPANLHSDVEHLAQNSPETLAQGVSHAFQSDQTPSFGSMVSQLFSQANPQQRTGLLSTLLGAVGTSGLGQLAGGGGGLQNVLSAFQNGSLSPAHTEQVPPQAVQQLAEHAEKQNPSVVDQLSQFVSQHPTLVKTLGATALTIAMSKIAQAHR